MGLMIFEGGFAIDQWRRALMTVTVRIFGGHSKTQKKNKQTKQQQQLKSRRFRYCVPIRRRKDIGGVLGFQIGFRSAAFERISKMFVTVSGRNSIYFKQTIGILFRVEDVGLAVRFQRRPFPPIPRMNGQLQARSPTSV